MTVRFILSAICMMALTCSAPAFAAPRTINLEQGQQKTWTQARPIQRAATGDDDVVGINVVPPRGVIITAKKAGSAMVSVWEEGSNEPSMQLQVIVSASPVTARASLGADSQQAQISSDGPKLRLSGALSSLERHENVSSSLLGDVKDGAEETKKFVDGSVSNFDVQVQIDIKIVEVSRSKLKEAGFYSQHYGSGALRGLSGPNNISAFESDPNTGRKLFSTSGFIPRGDAFNIFRWGANSLTVFSALESNGFAYTLAEPSLTAMSGQTASFLAGGELPIPIRNGSGSDSSISVQFKEYGIRLGLTPTVLDQNRITLKVAPEVSEVDQSTAVNAGGFSIPGLRVRRTETTVGIGDGETFVISGLVSRNTVNSVDKFPFLGDIPILGAFFRSTHFERDDKELLMIATPHLVRPFAKGAKLPNLPGEEVRNYDSGILRFLLLDSGRIDQPDSGFSQ